MSKDICKELRDVSRRSPSGISGCCLDAANEIEVLRAENEALRADIARHVQIAAEQAADIAQLHGLLTQCVPQIRGNRGAWVRFHDDVNLEGQAVADERLAECDDLLRRVNKALAAKGDV